MKAFVLAGLLALATTSASAQDVEGQRKLYALADAAPDFCPDIETGWFVRGSIGYDMSADGYENFAAARDEWLDMFRSAGPRSVVCEFIMQQYGPGGSPELFQFK